ncbi:MAG: alpha/beta hydrolase [Planctomycetales bacterium]|nr:alpha/beta hydrolase [bacterium]UNM07205.1 MAG: alpha/beta hydrolase [Planctomycetales bacterium]
MQFIGSGGARIWTCASGAADGIPVLMFNGGPGCSDYLSPVAELIVERCRVVRFESRGCGRSDWDGNYDLATTIADAEAVRCHYEMDNCVLLGHSQGPNHALVHAISYPQQVRAIIGIAGGKVIDDRSWSEEFHRRWDETGGDLQGLEFHADEQVNKLGNATWREYCRSESVLRDIAALELPVAFINGAEDIRPNWPTRQLSALLQVSRYVEIAGAAHMPWFTHPDEFRRELHAALDWIESR